MIALMQLARHLPRGTRAGLALLAACGSTKQAREPDSARGWTPDAAAPTPAAATTRRRCGRAPAATATVRTIVVSENARGMVTAVRWALSPDECALLVVEDPVGVEAEMIPDAVRYAASTADGVRLLAVDSVWDAAPDSAWTRLAVGRAHVARAGESDTLPASAWAGLARAAGRPERDVRDAAFAASGMTVAQGVARPLIYTLAPRPDAPPRALPLLGGWRVRWGQGDTTLLLGAGPARTGDDEPPRAWLRVDARTGRALGATSPAAGGPRVVWRETPLLDVSSEVSLVESRSVDLPWVKGRVEGEAGAIERVDASGARLALGRGVPLAATADGRVVLALAPRDRAVREGELAWRVVLYVVE